MSVMKVDPRSIHKEYIARKCVDTDYTDRYGGQGSKHVYKLVLDTPLDPGDSDEIINERLIDDLGDTFPDIGLISHTETTKRVFSEDVYVPLGCRKVIDWAKGLVSLDLLLYEPFEGFHEAVDDADESVEEEQEADPNDYPEEPEPEQAYREDLYSFINGSEPLNFE